MFLDTSQRCYIVFKGQFDKKLFTKEETELLLMLQQFYSELCKPSLKQMNLRNLWSLLRTVSSATSINSTTSVSLLHEEHVTTFSPAVGRLKPLLQIRQHDVQFNFIATQSSIRRLSFICGAYLWCIEINAIHVFNFGTLGDSFNEISRDLILLFKFSISSSLSRTY